MQYIMLLSSCTCDAMPDYPSSEGGMQVGAERGREPGGREPGAGWTESRAGAVPGREALHLRGVGECHQVCQKNFLDLLL